MLTTLLATPAENLTIGQLVALLDAAHRAALGSDPATTLGALLG
jgi:hypothetical protein